MARTVPRPQCLRCHGPIRKSDLFVHQRGEWLHLRCSSIFLNRAVVRDSRELVRRRRDAIHRAQQRSDGARRAAPPGIENVICIVCRTVIASGLVLTHSGLLHPCVGNAV